MSDSDAGDLAPPPPRPRPLSHRVVAGIALAALLAAGILVSWWIVTGQADFGARVRPAAPPANLGDQADQAVQP